jgi:hypothetical protein
MARRPHPRRAGVDIDRPVAWATDDRSGFICNHSDLRWEVQWAGMQLVRTGFLVHTDFLDIPNEQFRTLIIPPDPDPLFNARPEPYTIDETDWRVTQDSSIRETQGGALRVVQSSETEAETEGTN